jgi:phosphoribosylformylglycinamidine synthase
MDLPSRHGEGKFLAESRALAERLAVSGQVAARYVDRAGRPTVAWPDNPSGSPGGVAGICDPSGRLFGLMPHPDAYLYAFQHPVWARRQASGEPLDGDGAGLQLFRNGVDAATAESKG